MTLFPLSVVASRLLGLRKNRHSRDQDASMHYSSEDCRSHFNHVCKLDKYDCAKTVVLLASMYFLLSLSLKSMHFTSHIDPKSYKWLLHEGSDQYLPMQLTPCRAWTPQHYLHGKGASQLSWQYRRKTSERGKRLAPGDYKCFLCQFSLTHTPTNTYPRECVGRQDKYPRTPPLPFHAPPLPFRLTLHSVVWLTEIDKNGLLVKCILLWACAWQCS
jgi:hypothetical protein